MRVSADKIDKFDLGPITEAYDIELPVSDDEAAEVFRRWPRKHRFSL